MEKDEIGFDLAVNEKINSFVNGRLIISTIKATHSLHSFVL
jgi:hypothetical protein